MSTPAVQTAASRWVDDHGERLYRYASVRVRKSEVTEDVVQETFPGEFWQLWVMLHRVRMALRECLEINWFDKPAGGTA